MLRKLIRLEASDLWLLWIPFGVFFLLQLVTGCAMLLGENTCPLISPIAMLCICTLVSFGVTISHSVLTFTQALRMSVPRRRALALTSALSLVMATVFFGAGAMLVLAEQALGKWVWPLLSPGVQIRNFLGILPWWGYVPAYAGSLVAGWFVGAGLVRFGGRFAWLLWALWMAFFFLSDKLPQAPRFQHAGGTLVALVALTAALLFGAVWSQLHAVIRR